MPALCRCLTFITYNLNKNTWAQKSNLPEFTQLLGGAARRGTLPPPFFFFFTSTSVLFWKDDLPRKDPVRGWEGLEAGTMQGGVKASCKKE